MAKFLSFFFNPGVRLVYCHRLVYWLFQYKLLRVFSLIIWQVEVSMFATHISPRCYIPKSTIFPHPTGIVLGDNVKLGKNVVIYQNVTIGLKRRTDKFYPVIQDNVIIYAGSVVVGEIIVGQNSKLGANSFVAKSVLEKSTIHPLISHI
jgi:serine O-acetyltransferase